MSDLTREDLLREEALVRAREVCSQGQVFEADKVVETATKFYEFLTQK
jgi:hypothetical protein